MAHFGTEEVASLAIVFRLENVATMPVMGLSIALVTLVGMFYGAKRFDLLKGIIYYAMKIGLLYTSFMGAIFFMIPHPFFRIFTPYENLLSLGSAYMRINVFTFPLMVVAMIVSRAMQGMGYGLPGLIINVFRVILVAIPAGYIFVYVLGYGYLSVGIAAVSGGVVSNIIGLIWLRIKLKKVILQPSITRETIQPALEKIEGE
jgi:Na+-driven multidrug efflux pump